MPRGKVARPALILVTDRPGSVVIECLPGVPLSEEARYWHDDAFAYQSDLHDRLSNQHRSALRQACAHAKAVADKYHCHWQTNF